MSRPPPSTPSTGSALPRHLRIVVTGASGAGKTTLGRRLSRLLGAELFELDELPHELRPGHPLSREELRTFLVPRLQEADSWVVESDLAEVPPEALRRATTLIWLDQPRSLRVRGILRRHGIVLVLGSRSGHGITRRRVLGDLRHGWTAHEQVASEYERRLADLDTPAAVIRLRDRRSVESWLRDLERTVASARGGGNDVAR